MDPGRSKPAVRKPPAAFGSGNAVGSRFPTTLPVKVPEAATLQLSGKRPQSGQRKAETSSSLLLPSHDNEGRAQRHDEGRTSEILPTQGVQLASESQSVVVRAAELELKVERLDLKGGAGAEIREGVPGTGSQEVYQQSDTEGNEKLRGWPEERGAGPGEECATAVHGDSRAHEGLLTEGRGAGVDALQWLLGLEERERMAGVGQDAPPAAQIEREEFERRRLAAEQQAWEEEHALQRQAMAVQQQRLEVSRQMLKLETARLEQTANLVHTNRRGAKRGGASQGWVQRPVGDKRQKVDQGGFRTRHGGSHTAKEERRGSASRSTSARTDPGATRTSAQGAPTSEKMKPWHRATKFESERLKRTFGKELVAVYSETTERDLYFERIWRRISKRMSSAEDLRRKTFTSMHYNVAQKTFFGNQSGFLQDVLTSGWIRAFEPTHKTLQGVCIRKIAADLDASKNGQAELVSFEKLPAFIEVARSHEVSMSRNKNLADYMVLALA